MQSLSGLLYKAQNCCIFVWGVANLIKRSLFRWRFPPHLVWHRKRSYSALFCVLQENKNSRFRLEIRSLLLIAFLQSGATRNRNITISDWISLMYLLAKEVISRYCSTGFLQYFAVSCGVDFLLLYKGNSLFWNTSRCLMFLLHLGVET